MLSCVLDVANLVLGTIFCTHDGERRSCVVDVIAPHCVLGIVFDTQEDGGDLLGYEPPPVCRVRFFVPMRAEYLSRWM